MTHQRPQTLTQRPQLSPLSPLLIKQAAVQQLRPQILLLKVRVLP